jgi:hypothetical protein
MLIWEYDGDYAESLPHFTLISPLHVDLEIPWCDFLR